MMCAPCWNARHYYVNLDTHDILWDAPNEVRFDLHAKIQSQLLAILDPEEIEDVRVSRQVSILWT